MERLPVEEILPELRTILGPGRRLVLQAPPGAGKTTSIPLALLDETWLASKKILMLEPRRLAARAAATRMAALLGEPVGATVGYRVRFDSKVSAKTRIEVITEGMLTRRLQVDPELQGVGLVIFDEFHERHLHSDLALALCLDAASALHDDLALLIMSATLDGERLAGWLDAPLLVSAGRSWPVEIHYTATPPQGSISTVTATAVRRILPETSGDVLVFLPGAGEINRVAEKLHDLPVVLHLLHGNLPLDEQQRAINPDAEGRRKIVLATNLAESSLTIEGIRVVVDSGWAREARFDPNKGFTHLALTRISRASADQRTGRAGRQAAGICYRLWTEGMQRSLLQHGVAEIMQADLASLVLELAQWGVTDRTRLQWLDSPPAGAFRQAHDLLNGLGALDHRGRITLRGREMLALPMHPRLAYMVLQARDMGLAGNACDVAALLAERDLFSGSGQTRYCDFAIRLSAMQNWRNHGHKGVMPLGANPQACAAVEHVARQWRKLLGADTPVTDAADKAGMLLALVYPERIAQHQGGSGRYRMANGHATSLGDDCLLPRTEWLAVAELSGNPDENRIRTAAVFQPQWLEELFPEQLAWVEEIIWDTVSETVVAQQTRRYQSLVLESKPLTQAGEAPIRTAMLEGIRQMGLDALPWTDDARQLQARVACMRIWFEQESWPDMSDARLLDSLGDWLLPYLSGIRRREHLVRLKMTEILRSTLDWQKLQRLDTAAPTHLPVPSGSHKRLHYTAGEPPVLAVKLQELFGLAETPRIADGKVAVLLHLLSPAQRPIQITQDLQSFWLHTYAEVKKELRGRYPKHPWPDDPMNAPPARHTKPRK